MLLVSLILAPVMLGVLLYKLPGTAAKTVALAGQVGIAALGVIALDQARSGEFFEILGGDDRVLYIALRGDTLTVALALLAQLLFVAGLLYSMREDYWNNKLLLLLLVLQGLAVGIFLTDDIFNLFVFIEVSTIAGILALMFRKGIRNYYDGLYYLTIQIVSMMFFLFGIAYVYRAFGVLSVTEIAQALSAGVPDGQSLVLPIAFMLTGLALKVGFFPLASWVPRCYGNPGAPTAVIALMSGLIIKGSLFWIARLALMFTPAVDYRGFLAALGVITAVAGAVKALANTDIRLVLAYSTISQIGLISLGLFVGGPTATDGALLHIFGHAVAKTALFLVAGMIVRVYGTGNLRHIRGLARRMPAATVVALICLLSMAGLPGLAGGASKYLIEAGVSGTWAAPLMYLLNFLTICVLIRIVATFFGRDDQAPPATEANRVSRVHTAVVIVLAALVIAGGVAAPQAGNLLLGDALTGASHTALSISPMVMVSKLAVLVLMLAVAVLIYRVTYLRARALRPVLERSLSLPHAVLALTVFFVVTTLVGALPWGVLA
jgi:multicomponent Na+:H+ antiporter subunit D